jgi:transposase
MAYDIKYRHRALEYWSEGKSKEETAKVFKVSPSTLQGWKSRLKETGTLAPKKRRQTWRKIEPGKLQEYIEAHSDAYLREIAAEFGCTIHAVEKALARLKISRKKNSGISGKGRRKTTAIFTQNQADIG